jgi:hypothetical protein
MGVAVASVVPTSVPPEPSAEGAAEPANVAVGQSASEVPAEPARRSLGKIHAAAEPPAAGADARAASLRQQVERLDQVRGLLARHDPRTALTVLDSYTRDFPTPALGPEAKVLEVQALVDLGERSRATTIARDFLRANPASPHRRQLEALVGASSPAD